MQGVMLSPVSAQGIWRSLCDLSCSVQLFVIIGDYTVTVLAVSDVSYLAATALKNGVSQMRMETVPGTVTQGEDGLAQYVTDDQALREMVLNLFYESEQTESYESQE